MKVLLLRSWELETKPPSKTNRNGESLNVRGRQKERTFSKRKGKTCSKSRNSGNNDKWWKNLKCYTCHEVGHTRRFFPKRNKRPKEKEDLNGDDIVAEDGYESSEVLLMSTGGLENK